MTLCYLFKLAELDYNVLHINIVINNSHNVEAKVRLDRY